MGEAAAVKADSRGRKEKLRLRTAAVGKTAVTGEVP